jgi:hypothetical protein
LSQLLLSSQLAPLLLLLPLLLMWKAVAALQQPSVLQLCSLNQQQAAAPPLPQPECHQLLLLLRVAAAPLHSA